MGDREVSYYCLKKLVEKNINPVLFLFPKLKDTFYIDKVKKEFPNVNFIEGLSFRNEKNLDIMTCNKSSDGSFIPMNIKLFNLD